jgi:hypothetical protein
VPVIVPVIVVQCAMPRHPEIVTLTRGNPNPVAR